MVCNNVCLDLSPLVSAIPDCVIPGDPDWNPDRFGEYPVTYGENPDTLGLGVYTVPGLKLDMFGLYPDILGL